MADVFPSVPRCFTLVYSLSVFTSLYPILLLVGYFHIWPPSLPAGTFSGHIPTYVSLRALHNCCKSDDRSVGPDGRNLHTEQMRLLHSVKNADVFGTCRFTQPTAMLSPLDLNPTPPFLKAQVWQTNNFVVSQQTFGIVLVTLAGGKQRSKIVTPSTTSSTTDRDWCTPAAHNSPAQSAGPQKSPLYRANHARGLPPQ